jgi:hypothetical protein
MTTPRDLLIVTMDAESGPPVEQGDLSLALAGAELIDLLGAGAVVLEGGHIVPGDRRTVDDRLLGEAASSVPRQAPYDSLADWLWHRGRDLAAAYLLALEGDGEIARQRRRGWAFFKPGRLTLVDSSARRRAAERLASDEPVLVALAAALGIRGGRTGDLSRAAGDTAAAVVGAVDDAVRELAAERERRARRRNDAAVDNVQRGY